MSEKTSQSTITPIANRITHATINFQHPLAVQDGSVLSLRWRSSSPTDHIIDVLAADGHCFVFEARCFSQQAAGEVFCKKLRELLEADFAAVELIAAWSRRLGATPTATATFGPSRAVKIFPKFQYGNGVGVPIRTCNHFM